MKVKALKSFSGLVSMYKDEEKEITSKEVLTDLLNAQYVEEVKAEKKKVVKADESK
jgi:hypothetical protein